MEISVSANNQSSPPAKIALFRSFFRGREEVYPKRFENKKTGKSGYVFACGNEWVRGICEKPKIKCSDCKHRHLLPITDDNGVRPDIRTFENHLFGSIFLHQKLRLQWMTSQCIFFLHGWQVYLDHLNHDLETLQALRLINSQLP